MTWRSVGLSARLAGYSQSYQYHFFKPFKCVQYNIYNIKYVVEGTNRRLVLIGDVCIVLHSGQNYKA